MLMHRKTCLMAVQQTLTKLLSVFSLQILQRSENSVSIGFEKNKVVISTQPFRIDFMTEEEPVISVNAQGLLKFEHYRKKAGQK